MNKIFSFVPNLITILNLVCGSLATMMAIEGHLGYAGVFILIAGIFDFLDGFAARLLKAYSEIGKQLDSLADVVSFGVAPGMVAFFLLKKSMPGMNLALVDITAGIGQWFLLMIPFMVPAFSALRLAKFNIDTRQTVNFIGMPTPANAILWASFGIITEFSSDPEIPILLFTAQNLLMTVVITSLLLVSELPMFSLKFGGVSLQANWYRYLFLLASLLLLIVLGLLGLH